MKKVICDRCGGDVPEPTERVADRLEYMLAHVLDAEANMDLCDICRSGLARVARFFAEGALITVGEDDDAVTYRANRN